MLDMKYEEKPGSSVEQGRREAEEGEKLGIIGVCLSDVDSVS
jgi:hypothetical protein